ncbi:molybdopterin-dependent oxidoreductase, partial [Pseudomonas syringae]|uniref:molybdopterin-dependent oxidoreductase n=1 Tax=Pseudomonas syringae TaxID=317 RepID=UPI001027A861
MSFTSLHWGAYRPQVEDGKLAGLLPAEWDKDPSPIGDSVADAITSPTRIRRPAIRRSFLQQAGGRPDLRGQEPFVEVSWEVALDLVASELQRVRHEHGNQAIFGGSYGWGSAGRFHHAQSQLHRFLNCIGGFYFFYPHHHPAAWGGVVLLLPLTVQLVRWGRSSCCVPSRGTLVWSRRAG